MYYLTATSSNILQPSSTLYIMEETTPPVGSSVMEIATLTSLMMLSTPETSMVVSQSPCFVGGRTNIKENHSLTSNSGLYLQFIKSSNCGLSKRTFGIKICYSSSKSIYVEATLWTKNDNVYKKFTTLVQTNLPIFHDETCHLVNISNMMFMENTFFGIQIFNLTSNNGIVLNPTETSNWCIAEGYETNHDKVNKEECEQLKMDVAVAALFYPGLSST